RRRGVARLRGGGLRGAHRLRGADRAACAPDAAGAGQPRAGARGGAGRRHLPPRRGHARSQHRRAGGALRRRAHRILRSALLRVPAAGPRPAGPLVSGVLEVRTVGFTYPAARRPTRPPFTLREISFAVAPGEIVGVIGPNASGKTTLLLLLALLLAPARGGTRPDGGAVPSLSRAEVATRVGVVPQTVPADFPYSVEELVLMGRFPHAPGRFFESDEDRGIAREAMRATGVEALRAAPCHRRLRVARPLARRPRLLVLDEPTSHLDLRYQAECVGLLRDLNEGRDPGGGLQVVLLTHDL